jgi:hypothetical protein
VPRALRGAQVSGSSATAISLPPAEAISYFRQKTNIPTRTWTDLWEGAHVRAWSVAGVQANDMLADIRTAMDKAIAQGTTLDEFRRDIAPLMTRLGWQGKGYQAWRTRVVYETNLSTAYAAGRYAEMTDPDVLAMRPFWRYRHSGAKHPRLNHKAWDGLVIEASSPWWQTHYPPNGWGCGCFVQAIGPRQLQASGKDAPDPAPKVELRSWTDPVSGEKREVPIGIDPGWGYNVGASWTQGVVPRELQAPAPPLAPAQAAPAAAPGLSPPAPAAIPTPGGSVAAPAGDPAAVAASTPPAPLPPFPPPRPAARGLLPPDQPPEAYVDAFLAEFGATRSKPALFRDAAGARITISDELFLTASAVPKADKRGRGRFALLLAEALIDPDEIWVAWGKGRSGEAILFRKYLREVQLPGEDKPLFILLEWSSRGWIGVTAFPPDRRSYLQKLRIGALLFQRAVEEVQ